MFSFYKINKCSLLLLVVLLNFLLLMPYSAMAQSEEDEEKTSIEVDAEFLKKLEDDKKERALRDKTDIWEQYQSITKAYIARFPKNYKYKIFPIVINDEDIIISEEIAADDNTNNSYSIITEQSFGPPLSIAKTKELLDFESTQYANIANNLKGKFVSQEDVNINSFLGRQFFITYTQDNKKFGLRAQVIYTNVSKITMIATGLANTLYNFKNNAYFKKIKLFDNYANKEFLDKNIKIPEDYIISSANNLVKIKIINKNKTYTPDNPVIKVNNNIDVLSGTIFDPVRKTPYFYNIYTYKLDNIATVEDARKIVYTKHILNVLPNTSFDLIEFTEDQNNNTSLFTKILFPPNDLFPYNNAALYNVQYKKNYLMICELIGPNSGLETPFFLNFYKRVEFEPKNFKPYNPSAQNQKTLPAETLKIDATTPKKPAETKKEKQ